MIIQVINRPSVYSGYDTTDNGCYVNYVFGYTAYSVGPVSEIRTEIAYYTFGNEKISLTIRLAGK